MSIRDQVLRVVLSHVSSGAYDALERMPLKQYESLPDTDNPTLKAMYVDSSQWVVSKVKDIVGITPKVFWKTYKDPETRRIIASKFGNSPPLFGFSHMINVYISLDSLSQYKSAERYTSGIDGAIKEIGLHEVGHILYRSLGIQGDDELFAEMLRHLVFNKNFNPESAPKMHALYEQLMNKIKTHP